MPTPLSNRRPRTSGGFTLLEVLVATMLLTLIGLIIVQITNGIARSISLSNQGVDAAEQARLVYDRLELDLASAVVRPDADFAVATPTTPGTNFLTFLSNIPSADPTGVSGFSNRRMSLVAYRFGPSAEFNGRTCLLRAGRAIGWKDADFMGIPAASPLDQTIPARINDAAYPIKITDADFDALSPAVLQTLVGFQLRPDNQPVRLANGTSLPNSRGQLVYSPPLRSDTAPGNAYIDPTRIAALVVGLVVLDPQKLKLLNDASSADLAAAFDDAPATDQLPVAYWMQSTGNLANLPASVPPPARQSVRLYERFFPLPTLGDPLP